ncbi:MAG: hypothetical protein ACRDSP_17645 [Pseudonocardiaceae bacterium]
MTAGTGGTEPGPHTDPAAPEKALSAPTMLKVLLRERHWHSYTMFKRAYVKSAKKLDSSLANSYPSDRTFKRWVTGRIKDAPRAEHCAVLEAMFPGWSAPELFQPCAPPDNDQETTLLKELLRQWHLQAYRIFCKGYDDAARSVDSTLIGKHPTERQFYAWVSGEKVGLPNPAHCSVLEAMFPDYTARQLFEPYEWTKDLRSACEGSDNYDEDVAYKDDPQDLTAPTELAIAFPMPLFSSFSNVDEHCQSQGERMKRRQVLKAIGAAAPLGQLTQQAIGLRELVLNAAHSSAVLQSAIDTPKIADRTLDEARHDLHRLATDYVVTSNLSHILSELVILRDRLYVLLDRHGQRPGDARELHLLLGCTCVLLASISHDLAEPGAAMIQTRTALTFAELSGHAGLHTWVYCTRAMIASWWGSANEVLYHAQQAQAAGRSGIGAIRLAGLEARALAQSGQHQQAVKILHTTNDQREHTPTTDSLRDLGEVFTFSSARQHYYNAATSAHMHDWQAVERSASAAINLYDSPATGRRWPVTMTLSQVYLAQAHLNQYGPEGSQDALAPVLEIPMELRIPQIVQALNGLSLQLRSEACANIPAARDLKEAIHNFCSAAGS